MRHARLPQAGAPSQPRPGGVAGTAQSQAGRPTGTRNPIAAAYASALVLLVPLVALYLVMSVLLDASDRYEQVNGPAPLCFIVVLLALSWRLSRACPESVWSPAFWLPLQSAVFFGFGPLVEVYGNEATKLALSGHVLAINQEQLFRSNVLSTIGITCLLGGFWLHAVANGRVWVRALQGTQGAAVMIPPASLALGAITGGAILRYLVMKPAEWGMLDIVVPGGVTALGAILDVGFGIAAFSAARGNRTMRWVMLLMWPVHLFLTVLSLAKVEIVMAMLFPAIGAYLGHRRLPRLAASFAVMVALFMASQPYVHFGRNIIAESTGTTTRASYGERIAILGQYMQGRRDHHPQRDDRQGWWTRLNYSGVQAYAMEAHDTGLPGPSLDDLWMYFVPRLLWPGKPIMTGPGLEFHRLVTGHDRAHSFLGLSIYGDLYWRFGWIGVILACPLIGWGFAMMSWRSIGAMRARQFIFVPAILIAIETAVLGPTKYVVNGIIGTIPIYVVFLVSITILARWLVGQRRTAEAGSRSRVVDARPG